jgi:integrase
MTNVKKVKYLKTDRGRYYYQRRVPDKFRELLGFSKWQTPCGDVSYAKAVQLIVNWAEEHDDLLVKLRTDDGFDEIEASVLRSEDEAHDRHVQSSEGTIVYITDDGWVDRESLNKPWQFALNEVADLDRERTNQNAPANEVLQLMAKISHAKHQGDVIGTVVLPPYPEFLELARAHEGDTEVIQFRFETILPRPMSNERYSDRLLAIQRDFFSPQSGLPDDPDDRDEYVFAKHRLERKISSVTPDPNSVSAVLEKYCRFNSIRSETSSKYRRELARLIAITGDVPINHIRTEDLKRLRDGLIGNIQAASIQAVFTPLKSMFNFAFDEDMIKINPMSGVKLPRDKRPIEERKWKPFEPAEVSRIMDAAEDIWGSPAKGLTDERREAIHMVVRVLAFSGMRPIEVIRLTADDVNDKLIRIKGSKTESSTRVVPLHPHLTDFPNWVANGGLETFNTIKTDKVGSVRHNFARLLRKQINEPILDPQKALYSLRSTFVNAIRRAGADIQVQRAILGHKEAGAIRHYDDGPEFEVKRQWVEATDPSRG